MRANCIVFIEETSLLDETFWYHFSKLANPRLDKLVILSREQEKKRLLSKLLLLEFYDLLLFFYLKKKLKGFNFDQIFKDIEHKRFKNNRQFNDWVFSKYSKKNYLIVSVGCPFIFSEDVLNNQKLEAINIHNSDIRSYRGQFGSFWEAFFSSSKKAVTLHKIEPEVDSGNIIDLKYIDKKYSERSIFNILIEKKRLGAKMLYDYLSPLESKARALETKNPQISHDNDINIYKFPTISQILRLKIKRIIRLSRVNFIKKRK